MEDASNVNHSLIQPQAMFINKNIPLYVTLLLLSSLCGWACKDKNAEAATETPEAEAHSFKPANDLLGLPEPWLGDLEAMVER